MAKRKSGARKRRTAMRGKRPPVGPAFDPYRSRHTVINPATGVFANITPNRYRRYSSQGKFMTLMRNRRPAGVGGRTPVNGRRRAIKPRRDRKGRFR